MTLLKNEIRILYKMPFTFVEVCAGGGGLSSGLIKAGLQPILLNDFDKDCCKTLNKNHPDINVICSSFDKLELPEADIIVGGVPCQSFSQSGLRKGLQDPRGQLMHSFAKQVNKMKPKLFMIENVKGLITHNSGETLQSIINLFDKEYDIQYELLNAVDFNVPQKRERVFIVGTRQYKFVYPEKNNNKLLLKDVLENVPDSPYMKYNQKKIDLFRQIPQGGCWVNLPEDTQKEYLGKSFNSKGGKRGILRRLSMNEPCLTLLCSPAQKQTERCHPIEERPLTIREYARIQTFDDNYQFSGSISSQYKQIGNAVPVELARQMGLEIIKCLNNEH